MFGDAAGRHEDAHVRALAQGCPSAGGRYGLSTLRGGLASRAPAALSFTERRTWRIDRKSSRRVIVAWSVSITSLACGVHASCAQAPRVKYPCYCCEGQEARHSACVQPNLMLYAPGLQKVLFRRAGLACL